MASDPFNVVEERGLLSADATLPIPGYPPMSLPTPTVISAFLKRELSTARLAALYEFLFLVSKPRNISPLHHQAVKGREICISERPDHHLVWYHRRIFIKPIPKFLFSRAFWKVNLSLLGAESAGYNLEASGFLRTYSQLIVHESDFKIASDMRLVPETFTWETWCVFIAAFRELKSSDVSPRYHYGEIRLTRLNFWYRIHRGESYIKVHDHYDHTFASYAGPMVFVLAAVTVLLGAVQIGLETKDHYYEALSAKFAPIALLSTLFLAGFFPVLYLVFLLRELYNYKFHYEELS